MYKKILLATITSLFFVLGHGKATSTDILGQKKLALIVASKTNSVTAEFQVKRIQSPATKINAKIDYNQYVKKVWVGKEGSTNLSFSISKIVNGKITGKCIFCNLGIPQAPVDNFTGTINKDVSICQFDDGNGNKGNMKLLFKQNSEIEVTIKFTDKDDSIQVVLPEGTFEFIPYNLNNKLAGLTPIKGQSTMVNLNSWGNVKFVAVKTPEKNMILLLTNKAGDVLYEFPLIYGYIFAIKAFSFVDVNKKLGKDLIIIFNDGHTDIFLQDANGYFSADYDIIAKLRDSRNNKDIKTVIDYLSKNYSSFFLK